MKVKRAREENSSERARSTKKERKKTRYERHKRKQKGLCKNQLT